MSEQFERTELLIGKEALNKLNKSRVIIFGVGGVGGYTLEALVRCGIGHIDLVDNDVVSLSNINRQIIALHSTSGRYKVDVAKERAEDINPDVKINSYRMFYSPKTAQQFDFSEYDYVIDAIDNVSGKILLVEQAKKSGTRIICAMGAGNKMNPVDFEVADISKTTVCPLARVMRTELKKRKIKDVKVVYSKEKPVRAVAYENTDSSRVPASISFAPSVMGLIIAGEVVKDLIGY